ncbi:AsmA-like C-terminal region-containing protein [Verrucomicrobium sp. 3C]|uniref:AsmA-like C-terminal region-containing protein n=1 Tax=Verrucomicrobium sp. 3C TaxID=1134055 RepID=UPI000369A102|nr:AsmA-like C-terminal region-containing protein [Verrucomicrobium sp. 3C]
MSRRPKTRKEHPPSKTPVLRILSGFAARVASHFVLSTVGLLSAILVAAFLLLRFYGVPAQIKNVLLAELEARDITISVGRLSLDPLGHLVASRVAVFRNRDRQEIWLQIDRVRLSVAWLAWWKGKPWIKNASVYNATIYLPITPRSEVELSQVSARVNFVPGALEVLHASARVLNLELLLKGRILLSGYPSFPAPSPQEQEAFDLLWHRTLATIDEIETQQPIPVEVDLSMATKDPWEASIHCRILSSPISWRQIPLGRLAGDLRMAGHLLRLEELHLGFPRGEVSLWGEADLLKQTGFVELLSNADPTVLRPSLPERVAATLQDLHFLDLPSLSGRLTAKWGSTERFLRFSADLHWHQFRYRGHPFDELSIPIAFDGARLFIPEAKLRSPTGKIDAEFLYESSPPKLRIKAESTMDPTLFLGVAGSAADRFLESLSFSKEPPWARGEITGQSLFAPQRWAIQGSFSAKNCSYKGVAIRSVQSNVRFQDLTLHFSHFTATRPEGTVSGNFENDFGHKIVTVHDLSSAVDVIACAPTLGEKFPAYVQPYRFQKPPRLEVRGVVDLNEGRKNPVSDLRVDVQSDSVLNYVLFQRNFPVVSPKGYILLRRNVLTVQIDQASLFDGSLHGTIQVALQPPPAGSLFHCVFDLDRGDFHKVMSDLYRVETCSGPLQFHLGLSGFVGNLPSLTGDGDFDVQDGYILSIPFLGGLSTSMSAVIPDFAMAKADQAHSHFTVGNGAISTEQFRIASVAFTIIGKGSYNFLHDNLEADARVNIRGPMGTLLFPISKLFEYHGSGKLAAPNWKSRNF